MKHEVATLSEAAAAVLFGAPADPGLELGALLSFARWSHELGAIDQHELTRAQILAEIDRTMVALDTYPKTPTLPEFDPAEMVMPAWAEL